MRISVDLTVTPFINGSPCQSDSDATVEVVNPSTGRRCLSIPAGCATDVDRAVAAARHAFEAGRWSEGPPSVRRKTLHKLADLIEVDAATLDAMDALEMGKPVSEAFGNAVASAELVRFYAEAVDKITGDVYTSDQCSFVAQRRVPRGVVAAVVPWNFPTYVAALKFAPALAAGNALVLKPSEMSSLSAVRLAHLAMDAGVPAGIFNVVPGLGETVGRALGLHCDVDMLAFTGSTNVGKLMLQYAGQSNLKVVVAECGGKSPQIVFDDGVDVERASMAIARMLLTNQGQICSVGSRLLVQESIAAAMLEKIKRHLGDIVMGDALNPGTTFGPVASHRQCMRIMHYIQSAASDGAELAHGGHRALESSGGYFVEPTILMNVPAGARVAREEIFGPVLAIIPFRDEADVVRIANDTIYGLGAYVWTSNISTGMRLARRLRSSVWINAVAPLGEGAGHAVSAEPSRQSGVGVEGGLAGMESYLRRQVMGVNHG